MAKDATRTKASPRRSRSKQKMATEMVASHDAIARRAFELYMARGAIEGDALGDWFQAERELGAVPVS